MNTSKERKKKENMMNLYEKQIKVQSILDGGICFGIEIKDLTDWLNEEIGKAKYLNFKIKNQNTDSFAYIRKVERYIPHKAK